MAAHRHLESNCPILHIQYFYTGGKLTSYHVDTKIPHQRRCVLSYEIEANTEPLVPVTPCVTSTTLPTTPHNVRYFFIKIRQICTLSNFNTNAKEFHVDVPLTGFNCYDACYNTNMATGICFEIL
jgi:hypothetical protein